MFLNFIKSLILIHKLLKKFFFYLYFCLYTIYLFFLQSLGLKKELFKI